jgi:hypothetical protein
VIQAAAAANTENPWPAWFVPPHLDLLKDQGIKSRIDTMVNFLN